MSRVCVYYRPLPEADRWLPGDRYVRPLVRRMVRGRPRPGGIDRVYLNLCLGLDRLGVPYVSNLPFSRLRPDDRVAVLGRGRTCLDGYDRPNPIVAGIGLMTHPSEWPTLCDEYPVATYLQHSEWAADVYRPYFGERCAIWPAGIDVATWRPTPASAKTVDFLVYDKIQWDRDRVVGELLEPIIATLRARGLTWELVRYGAYAPSDYRAALARSRAMIWLSEHESQGIAYQEAMAAAVPVLAWDQGRYLDPHRFEWGAEDVPTSSVPLFDERCGRRFRAVSEFEGALDDFLEAMRGDMLRPRDYVLENLTLERSARRFLDHLDAAYAGAATQPVRASRAATAGATH